MTSKAGRPIVGKPKINDIKVRLGDAMHKNLLEYCVEHDTIKVEAIRQANSTVTESITPTFMFFIKRF